MRRRILVTLPLAALVAWVALGWRATPAEELDPLIVCKDTHRALFENRFLRVIEAKVPAGHVEPKHKHPHGITVYMTNYEVEAKAFPDGKTTRSQRVFGTVTWSDAVVHEVRNVGKTPSHAVRIELK